MPPRYRRCATIASSVSAAVLFSACGASPQSAAPKADPTTSQTSAAPTVTAGSNEREVAEITPRVVLSHDGGLTTVDASTGEVVSETAHLGFLRLNNAGDGRHVLVSDSGTFRVFDAGIGAKKHGDHDHFIEADPGMTGVAYPAPHAGHVVVHDGRTTLFADGTGEISVIDSDEIADPHAQVRTAKTDAAHHGVALGLEDGSLLTTQGTEGAVHTVQVRRGAEVVSQTTDCPGVHGEAVAEPTADGDVVVLGCENGPVVLRDGAFHKVQVDDAYARSGNLAGSAVSPSVLGDYKVDETAEPERPTRVALIDTGRATLDLVDLGSSYWFRSLARGPKGEALVLTYDGKLNVIDPLTKKVTRRIAAISPWQEKKDWQAPGPALKVAGNTAYVTDANQKKLVAVDLPSAKIRSRIDL